MGCLIAENIKGVEWIDSSPSVEENGCDENRRTFHHF